MAERRRSTFPSPIFVETRIALVDINYLLFNLPVCPRYQLVAILLVNAEGFDGNVA
jgi:hypothetical protein